MSGGSGGDRRLALAAALLGAAPFLLTVPFCGIYLDDYSFLRLLEGITPGALWLEFLHYVPGRNLHIPFFYGLIELTGRSVPAMHLVGLAFDALNAALLLLLVIRLTGLRSVALACAAAFAVAPNHGETHFWITLIPQCQIPAALILAAFLLAVAWSRDPSLRRAAYAAAGLVSPDYKIERIFRARFSLPQRNHDRKPHGRSQRRRFRMLGVHSHYTE